MPVAGKGTIGELSGHYQPTDDRDLLGGGLICRPPERFLGLRLDPDPSNYSDLGRVALRALRKRKTFGIRGGGTGG